MSNNRRSTAAPIRNSTSLPQDTNKPSLLTTLPPEIGNLIYEHAFLQDGPMLIADSQEYTKSSFRQYDDDDESILNQRLTAHNCHLTRQPPTRLSADVRRGIKHTLRRQPLYAVCM
jgi:hypothetical protein